MNSQKNTKDERLPGSSVAVEKTKYTNIPLSEPKSLKSVDYEKQEGLKQPNMNLEYL